MDSLLNAVALFCEKAVYPTRQRKKMFLHSLLKSKKSTLLNSQLVIY